MRKSRLAMCDAQEKNTFASERLHGELFKAVRESRKSRTTSVPWLSAGLKAAPDYIKYRRGCENMSRTNAAVRSKPSELPLENHDMLCAMPKTTTIIDKMSRTNAAERSNPSELPLENQGMLCAMPKKNPQGV